MFLYVPLYTSPTVPFSPLSLARVLLKPSRLVLADEPTGSLDSRNRDFVMNRISALKDCVKTVIVVSHDDKFREISDNVIFLRT